MCKLWNARTFNHRHLFTTENPKYLENTQRLLQGKDYLFFLLTVVDRYDLEVTVWNCITLHLYIFIISLEMRKNLFSYTDKQLQYRSINFTLVLAWIFEAHYLQNWDHVKSVTLSKYALWLIFPRGWLNFTCVWFAYLPQSRKK